MVDVILYTQYCSKMCQMVAARDHMLVCTDYKLELAKPDFKPSWVIELRQPDFFNEEHPANPFNVEHTLPWGGVPAYDILQLERNEGLDWDRDLNLLFAGMSQLLTVVLAEPRGETRKTKC